MGRTQSQTANAKIKKTRLGMSRSRLINNIYYIGITLNPYHTWCRSIHNNVAIQFKPSYQPR